MKALVHDGPGERAWKEAPDPAILEPTDAIVRIDSSTIRGTDLHILGPRCGKPVANLWAVADRVCGEPRPLLGKRVLPSE
jgi:hypothetical protein